MTDKQQKQTLRAVIRSKRQQLSPLKQHLHSVRLLQNLKQQPNFNQATHIAFYWPNDGEIDPRILASFLLQQGKKLYLPILDNKALIFKHFAPQLPLASNRFAIAEPVTHKVISAQYLDLALMPLVAFDLNGNRLGMGGGFYDRTFAFKKKGKLKQPSLIGLAHSFQQVGQISHERWDIPLDGVATERGSYRIL